MISAEVIVEWFRLNYEQEVVEIFNKESSSHYGARSESINGNIPIVLLAFDRYLSEMTDLSEDAR